MSFPFQMRKNCGIPSCWWTTTRISVVSCLNTCPMNTPYRLPTMEQKALKILEKNSVNIVISDIMMPVMNGTELCRQIKTNMQWSHIPVILLTARMAEEYKSEGF